MSWPAGVFLCPKELATLWWKPLAAAGLETDYLELPEIDQVMSAPTGMLSLPGLDGCITYGDVRMGRASAFVSVGRCTTLDMRYQDEWMIDITGGEHNCGGKAFRELLQLIARTFIASGASLRHGTHGCHEIYVANRDVTGVFRGELEKRALELDIMPVALSSERAAPNAVGNIFAGTLKRGTVSAEVFLGPGIHPFTGCNTQYIGIRYRCSIIRWRSYSEFRNEIQATLDSLDGVEKAFE